MIRTMTVAPFSCLNDKVNNVAIDTSSNSSIGTAKRWLKDCLQNHDCSKSIFKLSGDQQGFSGGEESSEITAKADCGIMERPKRLIDLKAFDGPSLDARLTEAQSDDVEYTALSYCWGKASNGAYKTTTTTLSSHMTRISNSKLPLTIKHAFEITRHLGLQYIWVNALCILQDDVSDWEIEIEITSKFPSGDKSTLFFSLSPGVSPAETEGNKLTSRAWTCQERLLSARIIHFTDKQLYWECRKHILPEDGIVGRRWFETSLPLPRLGLQLQPGFRDSEIGGVLHLWYGYVLQRIYFGRHLTVLSDKLPAISGLAKLWSGYVNSPYLAGIWQKDLHLGLSWYKHPGPGLRTSSYISPSWSWAALEGGQIFWTSHLLNTHNTQPMIKLIEAKVNINGQDPFGRATGGFIKIVGQMQTFVRGRHSDWRGQELCYTKNGVTGRFHANMDVDEDCPKNIQGLLLHFWGNEQNNIGYSMLLLALNPASSHQYIRKGFAEWNDKTLFEGSGWKKGQGPWEGCKEQVITIV